MRYQVNVTLTEADYLAYNEFHALESVQGKKTIKRSLLIFIAMMLIPFTIITVGYIFDVLSVLYLILLVLFSALYVIFFKKILKNSVKVQVNRLKKSGKLPFDTASAYEFYEDKLVEVAQGSRVEQSYSRLVRICVVKDRYIFLYNSTVAAYILPYKQLAQQVDMEEFISFITTKCNTVEYY